jgi:hypothetical protein
MTSSKRAKTIIRSLCNKMNHCKFTRQLREFRHKFLSCMTRILIGREIETWQRQYSTNSSCFFLKFLNEILIYFARTKGKNKKKKAYKIKQKMYITFSASVNLFQIVNLPCIAPIAIKQFRYFSYHNDNYEPSTRFLFYFILFFVWLHPVCV